MSSAEIAEIAEGVTAPDVAARPLPYSRAYRLYLVGLSMLIIASAVIDREALSLVAEPLRRDLHITDVQVSLLGGLAFALFYALCAIPIGRLVDSGHRPLILAVGMLLWSCATLGTGLASVFGVLFALRTAVAVGEATGSPCALGMITDVYLGKALGRMIIIAMMGATLGKGVALIGGGYILQLLHGQNLLVPAFGLSLHPWQVVFVAAGAPGLILAPLVLFTVKDPERRRVTLDAAGQRTKVSFLRLYEFVRDNKGAVAAHAFGYSIWSINERSLAFWVPTYLQRAYHMPTSQAGYVFGAISVAVSLIAGFCVGWMVDLRNRAGRVDAALRVGRDGAALSVIPILLFPFMPNAWSAIAVLTVGLICASGYSTVTVAQHQFAPNQARAQYTGLYLLVSNLIGGILGPTLTAFVTEDVLGDRSKVGFSIAFVCAGAALIGAVILSFGLKPYAQSMARIGRQTTPAEPAVP